MFLGITPLSIDLKIILKTSGALKRNSFTILVSLL